MNNSLFPVLLNLLPTMNLAFDVIQFKIPILLLAFRAEKDKPHNAKEIKQKILPDFNPTFFIV